MRPTISINGGISFVLSGFLLSSGPYPDHRKGRTGACGAHAGERIAGIDIGGAAQIGRVIDQRIR